MEEEFGEAEIIKCFRHEQGEEDYGTEKGGALKPQLNLPIGLKTKDLFLQ